MNKMASQFHMPPAPPESRRRMIRSLTVESDGPNVPQLSRWIPVPDIPVAPVLSAAAFLNRQKSPLPSILDAGSAVYVPAGRSAIGLALRLAGVREGDEVLLPAYHCMSMVTPLSLVSATPVFYRINDDLSINLEDVARKVGPRTRAMIATNYFGFPQDLRAIRSVCDDHKLTLIEDCAHSFFGTSGGQPLGSYGDYAVGSLTKFFPVKEGGGLVTNDPAARQLTLRGRTMDAELRGIYAGLEDAIYYHRLTLFKPLVRTFEFARKLRRDRNSEYNGNDDDGLQSPSESLDAFDPRSVEMKSTRLARWISRRVSAGRIVEHRRDNYLRMLMHFSNLRNFRPVVSTLPAGMVPYMFPLWVDDLSTVFARLEDLAVPVQRFGQFLSPSVDKNVCQSSVDFSNHLIQLPCHQELRRTELDWILETVSSVMASSR